MRIVQANTAYISFFGFLISSQNKGQNQLPSATGCAAEPRSFAIRHAFTCSRLSVAGARETNVRSYFCMSKLIPLKSYVCMSKLIPSKSYFCMSKSIPSKWQGVLANCSWGCFLGWEEDSYERWECDEIRSEWDF